MDNNNIKKKIWHLLQTIKGNAYFNSKKHEQAIKYYQFILGFSTVIITAMTASITIIAGLKILPVVKAELVISILSSVILFIQVLFNTINLRELIEKHSFSYKNYVYIYDHLNCLIEGHTYHNTEELKVMFDFMSDLQRFIVVNSVSIPYLIERQFQFVFIANNTTDSPPISSDEEEQKINAIL